MHDRWVGLDLTRCPGNFQDLGEEPQIRSIRNCNFIPAETWEPSNTKVHSHLANNVMNVGR